MNLLDEMLDECSNVEVLAEGGQKKAYFGNHPEYGPSVIKFGEYRIATSLERISREVNLLNDIDSKYYPNVYDFKVDPIKRNFVIVEEYLDAVELTSVKGKFSTDEEILELLSELICALDILWERKVVHRDIKPANILITQNNEPRIIDLGIARDLSKSSLTATVAAHGPGTMIYAAPEQISNMKTMINMRTDFFLLGLLILELMHGFHPFDPIHVNNQQNIIDNILNGDYVRPSDDRDQKLKGYVITSLETKPYKRFRTVDQILEFLEMECQ